MARSVKTSRGKGRPRGGSVFVILTYTQLRRIHDRTDNAAENMARLFDISPATVNMIRSLKLRELRQRKTESVVYANCCECNKPVPIPTCFCQRCWYCINCCQCGTKDTEIEPLFKRSEE